MKKFVSLALCLLVAGACTRKEIIVSSPCNFDVSIEEVRGTKVWVKVKPDNPDATYAIGVISAYDPSFENPDDVLADEQLAYMKEAVRLQTVDSDHFADRFCFRGERTLKYMNLVKDTPHKLLLIQIDPREQRIVGKPAVVSFRTRDIVMDEDLSFDVSFDGGKMTITPSDPEKPYLWEYENTELIAREYLTPENFAYQLVDLYEDYHFMDNLVYRGTVEWDFYAADQAMLDEEDITLMIAGYAGGEMNTPLTTVRFICRRNGSVEVLEQ
ncbi:MAG: hypothetical protein IJS62_05935 [Bacteroidales bacterium]|nr:hypothetical protein [Bacteroidales bacterium]